MVLNTVRSKLASGYDNARFIWLVQTFLGVTEMYFLSSQNHLLTSSYLKSLKILTKIAMIQIIYP